MDINERYWKWKRAFNRRKALIGRMISISLIAFLVVLVAVVAVNIHKSDLGRTALANQEEDKSTIKAVKDYDYGPSGFQQVAENEKLTLLADFTTGEICVTEKASGMSWYSNPQDRKDDAMATAKAVKNRLDSQLLVTFVNLEQGIVLDSFSNSAYSVEKGTMQHTLVENGVKFKFGFTTANVWIPVQYTLTENGFQAEIVTSEIESVGSSAYMIDTIALLPFFGAGGLNDKGYLFVPDGSGALIDFNNEKQAMQAYNAPVYGKNPTIEKSTQETVRENVTLPVFGAKVNDHAFFGIITSGDACSSISAVTSKKDSSYNHVYANAALNDYTLQQMGGGANANKKSHSIDIRENQTEGANYCVRYFFLSGDDANYAGMSNLYRDYLVKNNMLKDSPLADEKYMVLDLIGAVSIKKYVLGVKRPVVTALTTYNDVCQIVKELKAQGVEHLIINYIGAMDSGLNNQMYDKVAVESVLGSKKEFKKMVDYLKQEGVLLFLETNPVDLYENGNGYKENKDSVKSYHDAYAFQYNYVLDTELSNKAGRWHLLRPALVSELTAKFAGSLKDWNIENLSIDRLGDALYSDYNEDEGKYISRTNVMKLWGETLKNADAVANYLMLHNGNVYCAPYADVITDVSDSHSSYDMQDQSVPFYQMTFQADKLLTSVGINTTVDYEYAFLKALETGSNLKYNLIYGEISNLIGTDYNTMVSYSYHYWKDTVVNQYLAMQGAVAQLAGKEIVGHEYLTADVTLTKYESSDVVINYGTEPYTYQGKEIAAKSFEILPGGAK